MPEPNATITGSALALGTVTLTGSILGVPYDALAIGFGAALVSLLHLPPKAGEARTPWRVFTLVIGASFLAGIFAPVLAVAAENYLPWAATAGRDALRIAAAALIGAGVHVAIPLLYGLMTRKIGGQP